MPYCRQCGEKIADDARFCLTCGANQAVQPTIVYVQQPKKPRTPGLGLGIAGMILGIIGLAAGAALTFLLLVTLDWSVFSGYYYYYSHDTEMVSAVLAMSCIYGQLSIASLILTLVSRKRGYVRGASSAGLTMSLIGLLLYCIAISLCIAVYMCI